MNIHLVSLGCARNLVDSEVMTGKLREAGCVPVPDPEDADVIIVNTCSFIESAANESIDTILALAELKKDGACSRLDRDRMPSGALSRGHCCGPSGGGCISGDRRL